MVGSSTTRQRVESHTSRCAVSGATGPYQFSQAGNTVRSTDEDAFQAQFVMAEAVPDGGVEVSGIALGDPEGRMVHNPETPSPTRTATYACRTSTWPPR